MASCFPHVFPGGSLMASRPALSLMLCCILLIPSFVSAREILFHVSTDGNDSWSGTLSAPNPGGSDGPFATLMRARDAVRTLKTSGKFPKRGGVTVSLRAGTYPVTETLTLTADDSGTKASPVTWRTFPGEEARLIGGKVVSGFAPVNDPSTLIRFDPSIRERSFRPT